MSKAKEKILAAAQQCFLRNGVKGTSVQDIADTAQIARSSFYRHFRYIDDILVALAIGLWTQSLKHLAATISRGGNPVEKWRDFIVGMVNVTSANAGSDPLQAEDIILHVVRLFYRDREHALAKITDALAPIIDAAKTQRELRNDVESMRIAEWLLRQAWALSSLPMTSEWDRPELERYIETFVLPGLLHPDLLAHGAARTEVKLPQVEIKQLQSDIHKLSTVIERLEQRLNTSIN